MFRLPFCWPILLSKPWPIIYKPKVKRRSFLSLKFKKEVREGLFIFCMEIISAVVSIAVELRDYLKPDQPFYALPPCGLNGYPVLDSYQAMAAVHLRELRAHQPKGPYMLGGNCNGGLVAYEMARQLIADGQKVDLLILIAATAGNLRFRYLKRLLLPFWLLLPNGDKYETRFIGLLQHLWYRWTETALRIFRL